MIEPLKKLLATLEDCEPTVTYHGVINSDLQNTLLSILEQHMERTMVPRLARKRLMALSVECLHNLYHHAEDRYHGGIGLEQVFFSVGKTQGHCYIATGNYVSQGVAQFLDGRLTQLRNMDQPELNEHFLQILAHPGRSFRGGAGLGLVEMMRKTHRHVDFRLLPCPDGRYYFILVLNLPEFI